MSIRSMSLISASTAALLPFAVAHLTQMPAELERARTTHANASAISASIKTPTVKTATRPLDLETLTMADFGDTDAVR